MPRKKRPSLSPKTPEAARKRKQRAAVRARELQFQQEVTARVLADRLNLANTTKASENHATSDNGNAKNVVDDGSVSNPRIATSVAAVHNAVITLIKEASSTTYHEDVNNVKKLQVSKYCSSSKMTAVKTVTMERRNGEFGFNVTGSAPVIVERVDDGPAKEAGVEKGDIIVGVNGEAVAQRDHLYVVTKVRLAQGRVTIQLATP